MADQLNLAIQTTGDQAALSALQSVKAAYEAVLGAVQQGAGAQQAAAQTTAQAAQTTAQAHQQAAQVIAAAEQQAAQSVAAAQQQIINSESLSAQQRAQLRQQLGQRLEQIELQAAQAVERAAMQGATAVERAGLQQAQAQERAAAAAVQAAERQAQAAQSAGTAYLSLGTVLGNLPGPIGQLGSAFAGLTVEVEKSNLAALGVAGAFGAAAAGVAGALGGAIHEAAGYESAMAQVQVASHASAAEMQQFSAAAMDLGARSAFTSTEVAKGFYELSSSGLTAAESLKAIEPITQLAMLGNQQLGETTANVVSVMRQFGMAAQDTGHIVAVEAMAVQGSMLHWNELGDVYRNLAGRAHSMGVSLEETTAALMVTRTAGLTAEMAGTAVGTMLDRLAKNSGEAAAGAKALGLQLYDEQGHFVGLTEIVRQAATATAGMTEQDQNAALAKLAGARAAGFIRNAMVAEQEVMIDGHAVLLKGADLMAYWTDQLKNAQSVQDQANIIFATWTLQTKMFTSSMQESAIIIGRQFLPALEQVTPALTNVINLFIQAPDSIHLAAAAFVVLEGGVLAAAAAATTWAVAGEALLPILATAGAAILGIAPVLLLATAAGAAFALAWGTDFGGIRETTAASAQAVATGATDTVDAIGTIIAYLDAVAIPKWQEWLRLLAQQPRQPEQPQTTGGSIPVDNAPIAGLSVPLDQAVQNPDTGHFAAAGAASADAWRGGFVATVNEQGYAGILLLDPSAVGQQGAVAGGLAADGFGTEFAAQMAALPADTSLGGWWARQMADMRAQTAAARDPIGTEFNEIVKYIELAGTQGAESFAGAFTGPQITQGIQDSLGNRISELGPALANQGRDAGAELINAYFRGAGEAAQGQADAVLGETSRGIATILATSMNEQQGAEQMRQYLAGMDESLRFIFPGIPDFMIEYLRSTAVAQGHALFEQMGKDGAQALADGIQANGQAVSDAVQRLLAGAKGNISKAITEGLAEGNQAAVAELMTSQVVTKTIDDAIKGLSATRRAEILEIEHQQGALAALDHVYQSGLITDQQYNDALQGITEGHKRAATAAQEHQQHIRDLIGSTDAAQVSEGLHAQRLDQLIDKEAKLMPELQGQILAYQNAGNEAAALDVIAQRLGISTQTLIDASNGDAAALEKVRIAEGQIKTAKQEHAAAQAQLSELIAAGAEKEVAAMLREQAMHADIQKAIQGTSAAYQAHILVIEKRDGAQAALNQMQADGVISERQAQAAADGTKLAHDRVTTALQQRQEETRRLLQSADEAEVAQGLERQGLDALIDKYAKLMPELQAHYQALVNNGHADQAAAEMAAQLGISLSDLTGAALGFTDKVALMDAAVGKVTASHKALASAAKEASAAHKALMESTDAAEVSAALYADQINKVNSQALGPMTIEVKAQTQALLNAGDEMGAAQKMADYYHVSIVTVLDALHGQTKAQLDLNDAIKATQKAEEDLARGRQVNGPNNFNNYFSAGLGGPPSPASFRTIGSAAGAGLAQGITDSVSQIQAASTSAADAASAAVTDALQIASPSRLWASYGQLAVQGFGTGITDEMGQLTSTVMTAFNALAVTVGTSFGDQLGQAVGTEMPTPMTQATDAQVQNYLRTHPATEPLYGPSAADQAAYQRALQNYRPGSGVPPPVAPNATQIVGWRNPTDAEARQTLNAANSLFWEGPTGQARNAIAAGTTTPFDALLAGYSGGGLFGAALPSVPSYNSGGLSATDASAIAGQLLSAIGAAVSGNVAGEGALPAFVGGGIEQLNAAGYTPNLGGSRFVRSPFGPDHSMDIAAAQYGMTGAQYAAYLSKQGGAGAMDASQFGSQQWAEALASAQYQGPTGPQGVFGGSFGSVSGSGPGSGGAGEVQIGTEGTGLAAIPLLMSAGGGDAFNAMNSNDPVTRMQAYVQTAAKAAAAQAKALNDNLPLVALAWSSVKDLSDQVKTSVASVAGAFSAYAMNLNTKGLSSITGAWTQGTIGAPSGPLGTGAAGVPSGDPGELLRQAALNIGGWAQQLGVPLTDAAKQWATLSGQAGDTAGQMRALQVAQDAATDEVRQLTGQLQFAGDNAAVAAAVQQQLTAAQQRLTDATANLTAAQSAAAAQPLGYTPGPGNTGPKANPYDSPTLGAMTPEQSLAWWNQYYGNNHYDLINGVLYPKPTGNSSGSSDISPTASSTTTTTNTLVRSGTGSSGDVSVTVPDGVSYNDYIASLAPHLDSGGYVVQTGLAVVHRGETYSGVGGGGAPPQINLTYAPTIAGSTAPEQAEAVNKMLQLLQQEAARRGLTLSRR